MRYISYDNQANDFKILLDKGDAVGNGLKPFPTLEDATQELMKYFFIGLALPNEKFWVNLRPDSPENILDPLLEKTDIGRIFLEADLQLKKDTSGMTSPQTKEGREYWDKLYKKAGELFGTENITIPTITRPWIVPNEIIIRESPEGAYIYKATLKVMIEEDYLRGTKPACRQGRDEGRGTRINYSFNDSRLKELNEYSTQLIKESIIPKLTYEVNASKRYALLRQVYYSLILAQWFKQKYSSFGSIRATGISAPVNRYIDIIDSGNLANLTSSQPYNKQSYFQQYQKSFKDGEYNLQEPVYTPMGQSIRRYVSGGTQMDCSSAIETGRIKTADVNYFVGRNYLIKQHYAEGAVSSAIGGNNGWDDLATTTLPDKHNPHNFRYIVHALPGEYQKAMHGLTVLEAVKNGETSYNPIDLLNKPERISEKPVISASYIDQDHWGTWSPYGFILDVPAENIIATYPQDNGTLFYKGHDWIKKELENRYINYTPKELLVGTYKSNYNEIVLTGTNPDFISKKVRVIGVFIKKTASGKSLVPSDKVNLLLGLAKRNNLPVVYIENQSEYEDSKPEGWINTDWKSQEITEYVIAFNKGGIRYVINLDLVRNVIRGSVYEDGGQTYARMETEELDRILKQLEEYFLVHQGEYLEVEDIYKKIKGFSQRSLSPDLGAASSAVEVRYRDFSTKDHTGNSLKWGMYYLPGYDDKFRVYINVRNVEERNMAVKIAHEILSGGKISNAMFKYLLEAVPSYLKNSDSSKFVCYFKRSDDVLLFVRLFLRHNLCRNIHGNIPLSHTVALNNIVMITGAPREHIRDKKTEALLNTAEIANTFINAGVNLYVMQKGFLGKKIQRLNISKFLSSVVTKDVGSSLGNDNTKGGIAFNALPIQTQAMPGVSSALTSNFKPLTSAQMDAEWAQIEAMVNAAIRPAPERLERYAVSVSSSLDYPQARDKFVGLLADILRNDETSQGQPRLEPALRNILLALESE